MSFTAQTTTYQLPNLSRSIQALVAALLLMAGSPGMAQQQQQPAQTLPPAPSSATPELFGPGHVRLPSLGQDPSNLGLSPVITEEVRRRYGQYVGNFIDPENTLDLVMGRPRILQLQRTPIRIQIPDENVATYHIISDREISLVGNQVGSTLLNFWFQDPQDPNRQVILSYLVRVIPDPEAKQRIEQVYEALEAEVNRAFPNSRVELELVGDSLLVRGEARDHDEASRIVEVVRLNAPSVAGASVIPTDVQRTGTTGAENVGASTIPGFEFFQLGQVSRESGGAAAVRGKIINLLRVPGEPQVMLRVTVAEVNRSAARTIGLNFEIQPESDTLTSFANFTGGLASGNLPMILDNGQVEIALQALRNLNLARSLAEPNLITMHGQSARFQAGGEFPVPVVSGGSASGLSGVTFVDFGVQLSFTPYIIDRNLIRLIITADVSTRSEALGATVGGSTVSGRSTRNFDTVVQLRAGQTLAVAGLIQQNFGSGADRIPGVGDLPLVGWMFGTQRASADEQELMFLVNAELVSPLDPVEVAPIPGAEVFEPDDVEFYLLGYLESRHRRDYRSSVRSDWEKLFMEPNDTGTLPQVPAPVDPRLQRRYQSLEQTYIIGPSGYSDAPAR